MRTTDLEASLLCPAKSGEVLTYVLFDLIFLLSWCRDVHVHTYAGLRLRSKFMLCTFILHCDSAAVAVVTVSCFMLVSAHQVFIQSIFYYLPVQ